MAIVKQQRIVKQDALTPGQLVGEVAFFDDEGNPVDLGGGGSVVPEALTAAQAQAGTATTASTISAKVLADEIDRRVAAAIAALPAG